MKVLIFSDTHLTHKFDIELFDYIAKLVKSADQVIINGDFWDAYLTTFNKFLNSDWKRLFPLLKKKNTVYIFGNHDKKEFMDKRYNFFSNKQSLDYEFKSGKRDFYVTHGHLIVPTYDNLLFFKNPLFVRFFYKLYVYAVTEISLFRTFFLVFDDKKNNKQLSVIKKHVKDKKQNKQFFIFGHSHVPNLKIHEQFISLGALQKNSKHYCLIEDGYIELID